MDSRNNAGSCPCSWFPKELGDNTWLPKAPHITVTRHRAMELELCLKPPSCLVAFIVPEDAMQAVGGWVGKVLPSCESNYDINLPGKMFNSGTDGMWVTNMLSDWVGGPFHMRDSICGTIKPLKIPWHGRS